MPPHQQLTVVFNVGQPQICRAIKINKNMNLGITSGFRFRTSAFTGTTISIKSLQNLTKQIGNFFENI